MTCTCPELNCLVHGGLKSCPFCRGEARFGEGSITADEVRRNYFFINCMTCHGNTLGALHLGQTTQAEAVKAWNTRAIDAPKGKP